MRCSARCCILSAFLLTSLLVISGCGFFSGSGGESEDALPQMEISVKLQDVHRCSFMSPEIRVLNAPRGTTAYDVELVEKKGSQDVVLGKGSWHEDGTGVIPEGALTGYYRGPCPSNGSSGEYYFSVAARKGKDSKPLAVRIFSFVLE
ncbi:MAG: MbtF [Desulfovibrionaceae bacterium]|nr:MbtF [Desulfovibrionaceae bacterium]